MAFIVAVIFAIVIGWLDVLFVSLHLAGVETIQPVPGNGGGRGTVVPKSQPLSGVDAELSRLARDWRRDRCRIMRP